MRSVTRCSRPRCATTSPRLRGDEHITGGTEIPNYTSPLPIVRKVQETPEGWSLWAKIAIRDTGFDPAAKKLRGLYSFRFWTGKNANQWYDGFAGPKGAIYHVPVCFADMLLQ